MNLAWHLCLLAQADATEVGIATKAILVLVHALVIATILLIVHVCWSMVRSETEPLERLLLIASIAAGFLAYAAARALGLSIPALMASSFQTSSPFGIAALGVTFPSLAGVFVAWFCIRMMKRDHDVARRAALLLSVFIVTMFADMYVALAKDIGLTNPKLALPNVTFVLGMVLYIIFTFKRPETIACPSCRSPVARSARSCPKCHSRV